MTEINISDITNTSNTGYFDQLMVSVNKHVKHEYDANRIKGNEYATVYLGALQWALQYAVQFGLTKPQTEEQIRASQVNTRLAEEQNEVDKALKLTQIKVSEAELVIKETQLEDSLLTSAKQRLVLDKDLLVKQEQIDSSQIETNIKQLQLEDGLLTSSKQRLVLDKDILVKQEQIDSSQIETSIKQLQSEQDLLVKTEQIIASQAETNIKQEQSGKDLLTKQEQIDASQHKRVMEQVLNDANILKLGKEIEITELNKELTNVTIAGKAADIALSEAQTEGFYKKFKLDFAKLMLDTWQVRRTTNDTELVPSSITDNNIDIIVNSTIVDAGFTPVEYVYFNLSISTGTTVTPYVYINGVQYGVGDHSLTFKKDSGYTINVTASTTPTYYLDGVVSLTPSTTAGSDHTLTAKFT